MGLFRRRPKKPEAKAEPAPTKSDVGLMYGGHGRGEGNTTVYEIDVSELTFRECKILDRSAELTAREREWYREFERKLEKNEVDLSLVPAGAVDIMTLLNDPACSIPKLAEAINIEPVLAGSVLAMANSPLFRGTTEVTDIQDAAVRLGLKQLKMALMTVLMNSTMVKGSPFEQYSILVWKHALLVSRLCQGLARPAKLDPSVGYSAGLFHSVGKVAILTGARHVNKMTQEKVTPRTLLELLHVHGYSINQKTIGEWNLPPEVTEAVKHYRAKPGSRYGGPYGTLVGLATAICHKFGIWAEAQEMDLEAHPALEVLDIGNHHLPPLSELNALAEEIDQTAFQSN